MYEQQGSSSTVESFADFGQRALLSSSVCFLSLGLFIQLAWIPQLRKSQQLSWEKLAWLSQVQIHLNEVTSTIPTNSVEHQIEHKKEKRHSASKSFSKRPILGRVVIEDKIVFQEAAPAPAGDESVAQKDSTEQGKLVQMHRFLTARFLIALNVTAIHASELQAKMLPDPPQFQQDTMNTHPMNIHSRRDWAIHPERLVSKNSSHRPRKRRKAKIIAKASPQVLKPIIVPSVSGESSQLAHLPSHSPFEVKPADHNDSAFKSVPDRLAVLIFGTVKKQIARVSQDMQVPTIPESQLFPPQSVAVVEQADKIEKAEKVAKIEKLEKVDRDVKLENMKQVEVASAALTERVQNSQESQNSQNSTSPSDLSIQAPLPAGPRTFLSESNEPTLVPGGIGISGAFPTVMDSQKAAPIVNTQVTIQQAHPLISPQAPQSPVKSVSLVSRYQEAFDPGHSAIPESQIQTKAISMQPILGTTQKRGWVEKISSDHGTTIVWEDESSPDFEQIPLISESQGNRIRTLTLAVGKKMGLDFLATFGVTQQPRAGIAYGIAKGGCGIQFSGRSEIPLFFDLNFQSLNDSAIPQESIVQQDRYFVFLNAEPGAHRMFLSCKEGMVAVPFPVYGGEKTYLNLTQFSSVVLSGVLHDEVDFEPNVLEPTEHPYRIVVNDQGITGFTGRDGSFNIPKVNTVGSYPLLIESRDSDPDREERFPHRYQISPNQAENLTLYRVSNDKVRYWVRKGPGQVDDQNGLIMVALPEFVNSHPESILTPYIFSTYSTLKIDPVYTISPKERPNKDRVLQGYENRFIGFDIPEGPNIAQVRDEKEKILFSELVITAKGVINIVGPY